MISVQLLITPKGRDLCKVVNFPTLLFYTLNKTQIQT